LPDSGIKPGSSLYYAALSMVVAVALAIMFANYHQMVLTMVIPKLQELVPVLSNKEPVESETKGVSTKG
jgi:hypothetical protein